MHAVNKMLQTQFPDMQGLQSTLKSQTEFDPVVVSGGYLPRGKSNFISMLTHTKKLHVFIHSMHLTTSAVPFSIVNA